MASLLALVPVESLQGEIVKRMRALTGTAGVYVSLNKTQKSTEAMLQDGSIKTDRLFFIDCVTAEKERDDVLHVPAEDLDTLDLAIRTFVKDIPGEKFIVIDALSTLLIFNSEVKVARFVKSLTEASSQHGAQLIAFSPLTKGEELLTKIFNFFDKVDGK